MITAAELAVATGSTMALAEKYVDLYNEAMEVYYISLTPERRNMFLANVGHESGGLRYTRELWGPTETQKRYEGRTDLGNTQPGDGSRFRGHGHIQTTGRHNHARVRDRLRERFPDMGVPDFEAEPDKLSEPRWAVYSACDFADMVGLNAIADAGDFDGYCDAINRGHKTRAVGDSNGYKDRLALFTGSTDNLA